MIVNEEFFDCDSKSHCKYVYINYLVIMNIQKNMVNLTSKEIERYSRHINLNEIGVDGQRKLKQAKVLIVGLGGLGSPAALYLAAAGIGTIGLIDDDRVSPNNLQRQILYSETEIGTLKTDSARKRLSGINPDIRADIYTERLTAENAIEIIKNYDVVLDCTDNFPARYLINDACYIAQKPYVYGSVYKFEGQVSVFGLKNAPCYRCLFPDPPAPELIPNCAEGGVLGVLPGIIGTLQAAEAIKLVLNIGDVLNGKMLLFDALTMKFRTMGLKKEPNCKLCGENPEITKLIDYNIECENIHMNKIEEIQVSELKRLLDQNPKLQIIDVREESEFAEGRMPEAKLIPLGSIIRRIAELDNTNTAYMICRSGKRSQTAIQLLKNAGYIGGLVNVAGGMLAWSAEIDPAISVH